MSRTFTCHFLYIYILHLFFNLLIEHRHYSWLDFTLFFCFFLPVLWIKICNILIRSINSKLKSALNILFCQSLTFIVCPIALMHTTLTVWCSQLNLHQRTSNTFSSRSKLNNLPCSNYLHHPRFRCRCRSVILMALILMHPLVPTLGFTALYLAYPRL